MDCPLEPGRDLSVRVTSLLGYANYVIREITLTNVSDGQPCHHKTVNCLAQVNASLVYQALFGG